MTPTAADTVLRTALKRGKNAADVPEWRHSPNNCGAAQRHYLEVASDTGAKLETMVPADRRKWVHEWLRNAVYLVSLLKQKQLVSVATETDHQKVWLDVFEEWRNYAKQ